MAKMVRRRSKRGGVVVALRAVPDEIAHKMARLGPKQIRADWRDLMRERVDQLKATWPVDTGKSKRNLAVTTSVRKGKIRTRITPKRVKYSRHITPKGEPRKGATAIWTVRVVRPMQTRSASARARIAGAKALFRAAGLTLGGGNGG